MITEDQAIEKIKNRFGEYHDVMKGEILNLLKELDCIKKSAKEEFEEYVEKNLTHNSHGELTSAKILVIAIDLANFARAAIEEEYQRGFASGLIKVKE
jgi:hypothetical protein